jgi:hypothetical protein
MLKTLKEISTPGPSQSPRASIETVDDDETAPLTSDKKTAGYGTGELRRRVSSSATGSAPADEDEVAETGAVDGKGGVMAGAMSAVQGQGIQGETEEESSDDGAVLVSRPEKE